MAIKITSRPFLIGAAATALAFGIAGYAWREEHRLPLLEIYVFNLKSGSSVFVRTPDDKRILINGGANSEVIRELTNILPFYSRRIDTIIATDADGKDVSGLIDILERYTVDKIIVPAVTLKSLGLASTTDQIYATFLDTVKRLKIPLEEVSVGDTLDLDGNISGQRVGGSKVPAEVLFPATSAFQYSRASAPEIILKISYGQTSVMLLGNATTKIQKFLASPKSSTSKDVEVNALVVPHSLSTDSLSAELMNKMKPDYFIYSQAVTKSTSKSSKKLAKVDPLYFILDDKRFNLKEGGTVKITSDGVRIFVSQ
jgi:beta-lactamase superfamily II metal-dependent hydrolase